MEVIERLRLRYGGRCGYCGVEEGDVGATLTMDHHRPRTQGGGDEDGNLVYCCPRCNEHKGSYWHEVDPPRIRLLHPGVDDLTAHLRELDDGRIAAITEEGDFLVHRLRLNRGPLVRHRTHVLSLRQIAVELDAARRRVHELEQQISELNQTIAAVEDEIAGGR